MFVGSDAIALAPLTDRITYLEEGDCALMTRESLQITDANGDLANRPVKTVRIDASRLDKGGYRHFMAKEIAEQPRVINDALAHYLTEDGRDIVLPGKGVDFAALDRLVMVACGTAHYACMTAKYWFEQLAGLPVEVDIASEFRYRQPPLSPDGAALFVSQSGETADTLAALRHCTGLTGRILSVVNVTESSIARESDLALPIHAGAEIGVASTKAFTCQLTVLLLLALKAARVRGRLDDDTLAERLLALRALPSALNRALEREPAVEAVSRQLSQAEDVLFLGRGLMYPLALEGSLKLKEISYIHAEAYASGELKHGPIALIDKKMPVVVMAPRDDAFRQDCVEHAGGHRARRQDRADHRSAGRRGGRRRCLADAGDAGGGRFAGPGPLRHSRSVDGLPHGRGQGHGRGSAAQPRKIRDGGMSAGVCAP